MKTLLATTAILVAVSTSAFAGPKAANLVAPINNTIETLETQVETLALVSTSLAVQLRDALDADTNAADLDYIADLEDEVEDLENLLSNAEEDLADETEWANETIQVIQVAAQAEESRLRGLVFEARDERDDLQEELDAVYEELETAYEDMDDLQEQNIDLQSAIDDDIRVVALTNKIHQLDGEIEDLMEFIQVEVGALNNTIAELEIESNEYWEETEELDAYVSELKVEVTDLEDALEAQTDLNLELISALEGIAEVANESAADQVLSFIASLGLDV